LAAQRKQSALTANSVGLTRQEQTNATNPYL